MDKLQCNIWDVLCDLSGEEVAQAFTTYFGNQLLNHSFAEHLVEEGYACYGELFEEEEEN